MTGLPPPRGAHLALLAAVAAALLAAAFPAAAGADEGPAAWLFDPEAIVEIELDLPPETVAALEEDPKGDYRPATFTVRAAGVPERTLAVGVKLKGHGSFRGLDGKAAFKVKFNELVKGQKLDGLKKLTLNNMVQDRSMLHETLAYEAFRGVGLPAPRTGYAKLTVNGVLYGLYLNVETYDDVWLPRWFETTAHLLEGEYEFVNGVGIGADAHPGRTHLFEVDEGDEEDLWDLDALVVAATAEGGAWSQGMEAVADLEQMVRFWAVERYIGHWDGYAGRLGVGATPNNFYLHSDASGRFTMLPWGTDQTWEKRLSFHEPGGLLLNRCLADAACAAAYGEAVAAVGAQIAALPLAERAQRVAALLAPVQAQEDPARRESDVRQIRAAVLQTLRFIAARPHDLADSPAPPLPSPLLPGSGAAAQGPPPPARPARLGRAELNGRVVFASVLAFAPGRAVLIVELRRGAAWAAACRAESRAPAPRRHRLACRLRPAALRALRDRPRRARVRAGFVAGTGERLFGPLALRLPAARPR